MKVGGIRCKISLKKRGSLGVGTRKKLGLFEVRIPPNGGHSVCQNAISSQNLQIFC